MSARILNTSLRKVFNLQIREISLGKTCSCRDPNEITGVFIPPYEERQNEPLDQKKARLLYQSRKRGMLENGLLLSTFVANHLEKWNENQLSMYDKMINLPSNDWDIYYWATGVKPTPKEFDNEIMDLFKEHIRNKDRVMRIRQPNLYD